MSRIIVKSDMIDYRPSWLEQRLEEYLLSKDQGQLDTTQGLYFTQYPPRAQLYRCIIGLHYPFDSLIYQKSVLWPNSVPDADTAASSERDHLAIALSDLQYLDEELIQCILEAGHLSVRHQHWGWKECPDEHFRITWTGRGLSPALDPAAELHGDYKQEGSLTGRDICMSALLVAATNIAH